MYKLLLLMGSCMILLSCNSGSTSTSDNTLNCPPNFPLFTKELGMNLINSWGENLAKYSPMGNAGYTDPYVGAAYFTGKEYLFDALLSPTVSPITRLGSAEIYDYFTQFINHSPQMVDNPGIPESRGPYVTLATCGIGQISGYYSFTYLDQTPETNARYTFQFQYLSTQDTISIVVESGAKLGTVINIKQFPGWYIMLQNSSKLPSNIGLPSNLLSN